MYLRLFPYFVHKLSFSQLLILTVKNINLEQRLFSYILKTGHILHKNIPSYHMITYYGCQSQLPAICTI